MTWSDYDAPQAEADRRPRSTLPRAAAARYDRKGRRILITLSNGMELLVPLKLAQGLAGCRASDLRKIEISPTGMALRWPKLGTDLYLPALLGGTFGTRRERSQRLAYWAERMGK